MSICGVLPGFSVSFLLIAALNICSRPVAPPLSRRAVLHYERHKPWDTQGRAFFTTSAELSSTVAAFDVDSAVGESPITFGFACSFVPATEAQTKTWGKIGSYWWKTATDRSSLWSPRDALGSKSKSRKQQKYFNRSMAPTFLPPNWAVSLWTRDQFLSTLRTKQ